MQNSNFFRYVQVIEKNGEVTQCMLFSNMRGYKVFPSQKAEVLIQKSLVLCHVSLFCFC